MLQYFVYKKVKKHRAEKAALAHVQAAHVQAAPVLPDDDEAFLQRIVSAEGTPPPLPERPRWSGLDAGYSTGEDSSHMVGDENGRDRSRDKGKGKENENEKRMDAKKSCHFSFLTRGRAGNNEACYSPSLLSL